MSRYFLFVLLAWCSISPAEPAPTAPAAPQISGAAAQSSNRFGIELFNALSDRSASGNKFVSPLSVYLALQMLYNGAEGETKQEFESVLHLENADRDKTNALNHSLLTHLNSFKTDGTTKHRLMSWKTQQGLEKKLPGSEEIMAQMKTEPYGIQLANSFWTRTYFPLVATFLNVLSKAYLAEAFNRDFDAAETADEINAWASKNTFGKIKQITDADTVKSLDSATLNATYFKADWSTEFNKKQTKRDAFRSFKDGRLQTTEVPTMHSHSYYSVYNRDSSFSSLSLSPTVRPENLKWSCCFPRPWCLVSRLNEC